MTSCPACGSEKVALVRTKAGYVSLFNLGAPHRLTCSVNKRARPKVPKVDTEMLEALRGLGWDAKRVKRLLPFAVGDTFEARFRAALAYADSEGGS